MWFFTHKLVIEKPKSFLIYALWSTRVNAFRYTPRHQAWRHSDPRGKSNIYTTITPDCCCTSASWESWSVPGCFSVEQKPLPLSAIGSMYLTPFPSLLCGAKWLLWSHFQVFIRDSLLEKGLERQQLMAGHWSVRPLHGKGDDSKSSSRSINTTQDQQLIGTRGYRDISHVLGENETWGKSVVHFHCVWKEEVADVSFWHVKGTVLGAGVGLNIKRKLCTCALSENHLKVYLMVTESLKTHLSLGFCWAAVMFEHLSSLASATRRTTSTVGCLRRADGSFSLQDWQAAFTESAAWMLKTCWRQQQLHRCLFSCSR